MPFIRMKEDTKARTDGAFEYIKAKNPDIKTYDDLQNYLLDKANPKPLIQLIKDDFAKIQHHLEVFHQTDPAKVEEITSKLFDIAIGSLRTEKRRKHTLKRLNELNKELEALDD